MNTIMDTMTPSFPEIEQARERILRVAVTEEKAFLKTLESGTHRFSQAADHVKADGQQTLGGEQAFELHDTYGFPIDLTLEMAAEAGLKVDTDGFHKLMAEQKARAKADSRAKKHGHTDLSAYRQFVDQHPTRFTGYETLIDEGKVLGLMRAGEQLQHVGVGEEVEVILDQTPMYAEAGGQLGDRGTIRAGGVELNVGDVQKIGKKLWIHRATVAHGELAVGDTVTAEVDHAWRHAARQAHSGTHLIHAALRQVLGPTAVQAGSMNKPGYLRFDFNYTDQLSPEQLREIEEITNQAVDADYEVNTVETSLEEAKSMGALALFGENYGHLVRVVEIGGPFSMELCGGTHVSHSSQIGPVAVLGESSVGSGTRRIEAYSGLDSFRYLSTERALAEGLATSLKTPSAELPDRIAQLTEKLKHAEKEIAQFKAKELANSTGKYLEQARRVGDFTLITATLPEGVGAGDIRTVATDLKHRLGSEPAVVVLGASDSGKAPFVIGATAAAVERGVKSGDLVKVLSGYVDGRGGGKPDMAQGQGTNPAGFQEGFTAIQQELERK